MALSMFDGGMIRDGLNRAEIRPLYDLRKRISFPRQSHEKSNQGLFEKEHFEMTKQCQSQKIKSGYYLCPAAVQHGRRHTSPASATA